MRARTHAFTLYIDILIRLVSLSINTHANTQALKDQSKELLSRTRALTSQLEGEDASMLALRCDIIDLATRHEGVERELLRIVSKLQALLPHQPKEGRDEDVWEGVLNAVAKQAEHEGRMAREFFELGEKERQEAQGKVVLTDEGVKEAREWKEIWGEDRRKRYVHAVTPGFTYVKPPLLARLEEYEERLREIQVKRRWNVVRVSVKAPAFQTREEREEAEKEAEREAMAQVVEEREIERDNGLMVEAERECILERDACGVGKRSNAFGKNAMQTSRLVAGKGELRHPFSKVL